MQTAIMFAKQIWHKNVYSGFSKSDNKNLHCEEMASICLHFSCQTEHIVA